MQSQSLNENLAIFKDEKLWVNWKYEKVGDKLTKVPYSATISGKASSSNPDTWAKYEYLNFSNGIGLMFPLTQTLLGVDIDHCLTKGTTTIDHPLKETIAEFLIESDTYTEISPSGEGLHLWFKLSSALKLEGNKHAPFEAYTSGRYFTVTNRPYKESKPVRTITPEEALSLLKIIGYPWAAALPSLSPVKATSTPTQNGMGDDEVLTRMFNSKHGEQIKALYDGDTSVYNNDLSGADMALCNHLAFWTSGNATQMDRLWLKSALGKRDKASVRKDYRPRTITTAIRNCREFYTHKETQEQNPTVKKDSSIVFKKSSEIISKPIDWLWEGRIAKGKVTMIAGDPGLGKSQVSLQFAAIVSKGGMFPCESPSKKGSVLLFSAEDGAEDTINPRLQAVGADQERIYIFHSVKVKDKEKFFDMSQDLPLLKKAVEEIPDVALIVIDPITAFLGDTDSHKNSEVRGLLSELSKVAEEHHIAIVVVTHLNKGAGTNAMNKITGSLAFVAAARAAYMVVKDRDDESRRLFLTVKNNLGNDRAGYAYRVESVALGNNIDTSKVVWEAAPVNISLQDALAEPEKKAPKESVAWLEAYLREHPDGKPFDEIVKAAMAQGVATRRTLDRASEELMINKIYVSSRQSKIWKLEF
jgi:archaellum biogenesis ATPase FlaH